LSDESDSPTTAGQRNGDGAEKQTAFGLTDDGLAVCSWADNHKFTYAIPVTTNIIKAEHSQEQYTQNLKVSH